MTKQYTVHVMEVVKKKKKKTPTAIFSYDCMMIMSSLHNYNTGIMMLIVIKTSFFYICRKFLKYFY